VSSSLHFDPISVHTCETCQTTDYNMELASQCLTCKDSGEAPNQIYQGFEGFCGNGPGEFCNSDEHCKDFASINALYSLQGVCLDQRCCDAAFYANNLLPVGDEMIPDCTSCDSRGICDECSGILKYNLNIQECDVLKLDGQPCEPLTDICENGDCLDRCCKVSSSGCDSCNSAGFCSACSAGYFLASGSCQLKRGSGTPCSSNSECLSGSCLSSCCIESVGSCQTCNATGHCEICSLGFFVNSAGRCETQLAPGVGCSKDSDCTSNCCIGGVCCPADVNYSTCAQCDAPRLLHLQKPLSKKPKCFSSTMPRPRSTWFRMSSKPLRKHVRWKPLL